MKTNIKIVLSLVAIVVIALGAWYLFSVKLTPETINEQPAQIESNDLADQAVEEIAPETPTLPLDAEGSADFDHLNTLVEPEDITGGWYVEGEDYEEIYFDEDGFYSTYLNQRPFEEGDWSFTADGEVVLDSTVDDFDQTLMIESSAPGKIFLSVDGGEVIWTQIKDSQPEDLPETLGTSDLYGHWEVVDGPFDSITLNATGKFVSFINGDEPFTDGLWTLGPDNSLILDSDPGDELDFIYHKVELDGSDTLNLYLDDDESITDIWELVD